MTKPNRKGAIQLRPKMPPVAAPRSPADRILARSALLARRVLENAPDDNEVVAGRTGASAGSLLLH